MMFTHDCFRKTSFDTHDGLLNILWHTWLFFEHPSTDDCYSITHCMIGTSSSITIGRSTMMNPTENCTLNCFNVKTLLKSVSTLALWNFHSINQSECTMLLSPLPLTSDAMATSNINRMHDTTYLDAMWVSNHIGSTTKHHYQTSMNL